MTATKKTPATRKPAAKKTAAKKPVAKKAATPKKKASTSTDTATPTAKLVKVPAEKKASTAKPAKKAAKKTSKARKTAASAGQSTLFLNKDTYNACIDGLMGQGLDREDAVETLKVGIRQANGRPVPLELMRNAAPVAETALEFAEA